MSFTTPSWLKFSVLDFESYTPSKVTESDNLIKVVSRRPVHRYQMKLKTVPLHIEREARDLEPWLERLEGQGQLLDVQVPYKSTKRGALTGVVTLLSSRGVGDVSITFATQHNNLVGAVRAGDPFRFPNHNKVYRALEDADTNGSGYVTVTFTLPMLKHVSSGVTVTYDNVPFTCRQTRDMQKMSIGADKKHVVYTLNLEEEI